MIQDGCAEFRLPYICSKPPIPGEVYSAACLIRINHTCSCSFPNSSSLMIRLCGCSTIATATGGFMHGCKGGHWVMGTSHSSSFLPPTLVRAVCQLPLRYTNHSNYECITTAYPSEYLYVCAYF